jgi:hypothetical protein
VVYLHVKYEKPILNDKKVTARTCPIVICVSVTNRVRAVTALHIWHVGRPPPDDVSRTIVGDLEL